MDTIEIIIAALALITGVCISLIPYYRKVFFIGPELTIELIPDGGMSEPRGMSSKNDISKGYIDGNIAIQFFEVTWKINMKITNNSNIAAYYPVLSFLQNQVGFTSLEKLDINTPLKEHDQVVLKGIYKIFEECEAKDRTKIKGLPPHIKDLKVLLEYKNSYKKTFYTLFSNSDIQGQNTYSRKKPKEFKNNNR